MQTLHINRTAIHPHPLNTELYGTPDVDEAFLDHIRQFGIQQPIVLMPHAELPNHYYTLGGHRRMAAAAILGLESVPATIEHPQSADEAALLLVGLNFQRDKTTRMKVREFLTLENLHQLEVDMNVQDGRKTLKSSKNQGKSEPTTEAVSGRTSPMKIGDFLEVIQAKIGVTYREARRIYVVFSEGYQQRQVAILQKKKAKQMNIDQLVANWDALRERCLSEAIGLSGAEEELYTQIKRAQRRKDKPEAQPAPPRRKPTLLLPFAGNLESEISSFTADDLHLTFGTVFHLSLIHI